MEIIYLQLLDEGTKVYKAVKSIRIDDDVYRIHESEIYDSSDEVWEFVPNEYVQVEQRKIDGQDALLAVKSVNVKTDNSKSNL